MSEYGDVVYRLGDSDYWEIYKETVEEWKAEKGFLWSELAFIALDPTSSDQFIGIRNDGTWAGSIDDINEDALETFALNFFAKAKPRRQSRPNASQSNGQIPAANNTTTINNSLSEAATRVLYETWSRDTNALFTSASSFITSPPRPSPRKIQVRSSSNSANASTPPLQRSASAPARLLSTFPYLPATITTCNFTACTILKADADSIHACQHDVEKLLRGSGLYSYEWLRQERLRWHPDRFGRLCEEEWRERGKKMAGEMFKMMSALIEEVRSVEGDTQRADGL